jgi:thioredoxin reductase (NADPH)
MATSFPEPPVTADVAVVGAGPIGLEMAVALARARVDYLVFEAKQVGYTMSWWPPNTHFFSSPERLAIAGVPIPNVDQTKITGEAYLAYLRSVVEHLDLELKLYEPVIGIERHGDGFLLRTQPQAGPRTYQCQRVILATGGLAGPNKLGIPGEDLPHVSHYADDPHKYFRTDLVVVGGRNSALEAALRCWRAGARVTISYRRAEFDPEIAKRHLLAEINWLIREGKIAYYPETTPVEITPQHVVLAPTRDGKPVEGKRIHQPADFVLLCTGFAADMTLFEQAGVELGGDELAPSFSPETMETNVPGLYVAGTAIGGSQKRYKVFIENCHVHVERIVTAITGRPPSKTGNVQTREYRIAKEDAES